MNILILAALKSELEGILELYKPKNLIQNKRQHLYELNLLNKTIYLGITGVGKKNVRNFFKILLALNKDIELIVNIGYAGAINPKYKVGDIIIANKIIELNYNKKSECTLYQFIPPYPYYEGFQNFFPSFELYNECYNQFLLTFKEPYFLTLSYKNKKEKILKNVHIGNGACVDKFLFKEDKLELKKIYPNIDFVDMESSEIVNFCKYKNIELTIIKVITDELNLQMPDMQFVTDNWKNIKLKPLILYTLKNPINLYKIYKLQVNIKIAKKIITKVIKDLIGNL